MPTQPVDEERFEALLGDAKWNGCIDRFRQTGDAREKRRLPAFIFQATFDESASKTGVVGRWRKQSATRLTGLVVMDIDHVENPREVWAKIQKEKLKDAGQKGIVLVYVTPSGKGLKIVFKARKEWGNLIDNQHAMAHLLGLEVDEACKDASRMSFICKRDDVLYLSKDLFTHEDQSFAQRYNEAYREGKSQGKRRTDPSPSTPNGLTPNPSLIGRGEDTTNPKETTPLPKREGQGESLFKGIPYSSIIEAYWQRTGGEPVEGERNVRLHQLAVNLRAICDNKREVLMQVMPRLGLDETEVERIVESACKETPKGISKMMKSIIYEEGLKVMGALGDERRRLGNEEEQEGWGTSLRDEVNAPISAMNAQLEGWGNEIEQLFPEFPALADVCKGLRKNQYPAALFVGGGLMMTLMTRCTYRFYHRPEELRRLNNSTLIIGDPASGKSFATRLYKLLAAPIVEGDRVGREAINAYREQMKTKGANKEKPKKPKVVVRVHPARTSNAQFIQDMVNSVEMVDGKEMQLHMLTFDTELDNTVTVQRGGSWIDKQSLELKAFHNEEDGQAYSNNDSVMQDFNVTWNFIYTGTPMALKRKVNEQNFGSGLATRLTCIPLPATNFRMMEREQRIDQESDQRLTEWAHLLDRTKGELPVQSLVDRLYDWTARRMMDAEENDSRADEMLLKRCAYHGLNFAMPYIMLRHWKELHQEGEMWCGEFETDEVDWQLAELICNIQFACQRYYFGAMAEKYFDNKLQEANVNMRRRQRTIECFDRLPQEFTADDVMRCFGLANSSSARCKINRLICDHLIVKISNEKHHEKAVYRKTGVVCL